MVLLLGKCRHNDSGVLVSRPPVRRTVPSICPPHIFVFRRSGISSCLSAPQFSRHSCFIESASYPLTMTYATIQPPFTLNFREMSKKELKDYFAWFQEVLPQRPDILTHTVQQTSGFETWQADLTSASLSQLGDWFAAQVETRPRTQEEIEEIRGRSSFPIEISDEELTNPTFSLAMDVGMYLSQVFLKNHPVLRWDQPFGGKKNVDYGQPVLVEFGAAPFNPVRMLITLAYGVISQKRTSRSLRDLYDIWAKMI